MGWRALSAGGLLRRRSGQWRRPYMDHIGFTLIALWDGVVIVLAIDLGAAGWLVGVLAVLGVVVGHPPCAGPRQGSPLTKEDDEMDTTLWLLIAALIGNGLLVGASLDQSVKQLPTRRRIGVVAFSEYSKAGDLGHGIAWYAALGIGAALLTVSAAVVGLTDRPDGATGVALWLALLLTVAHSLATARAAPTNLSQRAAAGDPSHLEAIFDRFERLQTVRAALQVLTLLSVAWALAANIASA